MYSDLAVPSNTGEDFRERFLKNSHVVNGSIQCSASSCHLQNKVSAYWYL